MFVKIFVIVSLIIWGLIGCATNGSYNQSENIPASVEDNPKRYFYEHKCRQVSRILASSPDKLASSGN